MRKVEIVNMVFCNEGDFDAKLAEMNQRKQELGKSLGLKWR